MAKTWASAATSTSSDRHDGGSGSSTSSGAVVFSVFGFLYVKNRGKKDSIISRFVPRRKSADRDYLRLVIDGGSRESHTNMRDTVIEQTFDCPDKLDA